MAVILETSLGDLTVDLYTEERPRCCLNFLKLCKIKYYNFCLFHSVQRSLVAQTGDPTGSGRGGESMFGKLYGEQARYFEAELKPRIKHKKLGTLSMANNGQNCHGSQFFLTLAQDVDYLDGKHTVFGEVAEGFEVLDKINETFTDKENRPYRDIRIFHTVILDDPFPDPDELMALIPDRSPEPTKEQLESGRIGVDEEVDGMKGKTEEEIDEIISSREAKARTQILEMIGDLPDAEVKPPDNVLFVCKLNPVTTDEDLEIIFSRFGDISGCEVIKDQKTGESLQYAFIEFEKPEDCESAYFKMDNVLIDDRRIHVDFSQSVAKLKWKGKGKGVEMKNNEDEDDAPTYIIKDRNRKDAKYDYVFEDTTAEVSKKDKSRKKKKKHKRDSSAASSSDSEDSARHRHKGKPDRRDRSEERDSQRRPDYRTDRDKDRDTRTEKDRDTRTDRDKDRDTRGERDRNTRTERDKGTRTEKDRDTRTDRDRGTQREKDRDTRGEREARTDRDRDTRTDRDRDTRTDRDRDRSHREQDKKYRTERDRNKDGDRQHHRDRSRERNRKR